MAKQDKALTAAQRRHTATLLERRNAAQNALNEWIEYLTEEHDAAGWQIAPDLTAFVRVEDGGDDGND